MTITTRFGLGHFGWGIVPLCMATGICVLLACGAAQAQTFAGTGSCHSSAAQGKEKANGKDNGGTWQLTATVSGSDLAGSLAVKGPSDFPDGNVFGSVGNGGSIQFGVVYKDVEEATFTGTIQGTAMSGTYTTKAGDSGTWSGTFEPAD